MSRKRVSPRNPFSVRYLRVIGYQLGRWCDIMGSKVDQKASYNHERSCQTLWPDSQRIAGATD
jgi:hypothetical protein